MRLKQAAIIVIATVARACTDGADELGAHVAHLGKGVLNPGSGLGNALVALLLAFAQGFTYLGFALDVFALAQNLEHLAVLGVGVAPVGIHIVAGIVLIKHFIKVRAVVLAGRAGGDLVDELVSHIHADAQLVAVVALAVLLGVCGVQVILSALAGDGGRGVPSG